MSFRSDFRDLLSYRASWNWVLQDSKELFISILSLSLALSLSPPSLPSSLILSLLILFIASNMALPTLYVVTPAF